MGIYTTICSYPAISGFWVWLKMGYTGIPPKHSHLEGSVRVMLQVEAGREPLQENIFLQEK
jgi:hypothetical protein